MKIITTRNCRHLRSHFRDEKRRGSRGTSTYFSIRKYPSISPIFLRPTQSFNRINLKFPKLIYLFCSFPSFSPSVRRKSTPRHCSPRQRWNFVDFPPAEKPGTRPELTISQIPEREIIKNCRKLQFCLVIVVS